MIHVEIDILMNIANDFTKISLSVLYKASKVAKLHQNSTCGAAENVGTAAKPNGIMHEPVHADGPNAFSNNSSSVLSCIQTAVDIPSQSIKNKVPPNMFLGYPSNMGLRQTIDGRIIKKEPVYGRNSTFAFGPHGSYLESRSAIGDVFVSSFSSVESNTQPLNEPLLDVDTTSFGFLGRCLKILVSQT
ncbi:hypothetical protein CQW23_34744 [Capsicum baccatum]|uniref:Uncharacterized protein n=1 Tax=Capsicum baccatum TaxID=33114 RepID=A0A2G2UY28_CAPBA|nr:hypothetical protein CQW23_34744 [Capsicum baccatum]